MSVEYSVDDNWYTRLGLPLGAKVEEVEAAFTELSVDADEVRLAELAQARFGLTNPSMRSFHNQRIKWAAAAEWHRRTYPNGTSVERHKRWADFRRHVMEEEPSWWQRLLGLDGDHEASPPSP
jgi:hypothetical protein